MSSRWQDGFAVCATLPAPLAWGPIGLDPKLETQKSGTEVVSFPFHFSAGIRPEPSVNRAYVFAESRVSASVHLNLETPRPGTRQWVRATASSQTAPSHFRTPKYPNPTRNQAVSGCPS